MKTLKVAHSANGFHAGISDLAAGQVKPDDAFGHGLKQGQLLISKFLGGVDHVDAKAIIFGRNRHDGEAVCFGSRFDVIESLGLLLGFEGVPNRKTGNFFRNRSFFRVGVEGYESDGRGFHFSAEISHGKFLGSSGVDPSSENL